MNAQMMQMLHGMLGKTFPGAPGGAPGAPGAAMMQPAAGAPPMAPAAPGGLPGAIGAPMNIAPPQAPAPSPGATGFQDGMPPGGLLALMQGKAQPQGIAGLLAGLGKPPGAQPPVPTMPPDTALAQAGMLAAPRSADAIY